MNKGDVYDFLVIGGGSGGIAAAIRASNHGARVGLFEPNAIGGTCVNRGCVPKKILWNAAELAHDFASARDYGFDVAPSFDYARLRGAIFAHVKWLNGVYAERLADAGVELVTEWARFAGPGTIETASGRKRHAPHVLLATGARPQRPAIEGGELGITSDDWFQLSELPTRLLIVGGGYVGVELAGIMHALGSDVTFAYRGSSPLARFDQMLGQCLAEEMRDSGIELLSEFKPNRVFRAAEGSVTVDSDDGRHVIDLNTVLWAIGRVPDARSWAETAGVALDPRGFVRVDECQNTSIAGIYAVGDVTGKASLTPVAIAAGRSLSDRLFGGKSDAKLDYNDIPTVVFSHPPIGSVGLSEAEARGLYGDQVKCYEKRFANLFYATTRQKRFTTMKLVTLLPEERLLGIHVIGLHADELLQGFAVALRMGARKADLDRTMPIHPTAAEELVTMA